MNKPFPWLCGECGQHAVHPISSEYKTEVNRDGILHEIYIPSLEIPTCSNCQEQWFDIVVDDQINAAICQQTTTR